METEALLNLEVLAVSNRPVTMVVLNVLSTLNVSAISMATLALAIKDMKSHKVEITFAKISMSV